jgi:hypothetical protein
MEIVSALNDAIDRREEGLVIKAPNSVYKPNVRNGKKYFIILNKLSLLGPICITICLSVCLSVSSVDQWRGLFV